MPADRAATPTGSWPGADQSWQENDCAADLSAARGTGGTGAAQSVGTLAAFTISA